MSDKAPGQMLSFACVHVFPAEFYHCFGFVGPSVIFAVDRTIFFSQMIFCFGGSGVRFSDLNRKKLADVVCFLRVF